MPEVHLFAKLDVNYQDDPRVIDAGPIAELLFVRSLALAKRTQSDGVLSVGQARRLAVDLLEFHPDPVGVLVEVGLWRPSEGGGFEIAGWSSYNLSERQISDTSDARRRGAAKTNHIRWHTDSVDPDCEWCQVAETSVGRSVERSLSESPLSLSSTEEERIPGDHCSDVQPDYALGLSAIADAKAQLDEVLS